MGRQYRSKLREERARQTRLEIVKAAMKLHGRGITEIEALADEAGVSPSTVRKHFPTKEDIFTACTEHFGQTLRIPSLEELAAIEDDEERIKRAVIEAVELNEATLPYVWLAVKLGDESPALRNSLGMSESFARGIANVILGHSHDGDDEMREKAIGFLAGLIGPLTYRALRVTSALSPDEIRDYLIPVVRNVYQRETHNPGTQRAEE